MKIPKEYENLNKYRLTPKTIQNLIPNRNKIQENHFGATMQYQHGVYRIIPYILTTALCIVNMLNIG